MQRATHWLAHRRCDGRTRIAQTVRRRSFSRRQPDVTRPLQLQQQRTAGHVLELTSRIAPVPAAAQFLAQRRSAPCRIRRDQCADQFDIRTRHLAPMHNHAFCHGLKSTATDPTEFSPKYKLFRLRFDEEGKTMLPADGSGWSPFFQVPDRSGRAPEQLREIQANSIHVGNSGEPESLAKLGKMAPEG